MTLLAVYIAVTLLCALLILVSYLDRLYTESGKFLTREFQENIEAFEKLVEPRLLRASARARSPLPCSRNWLQQSSHFSSAISSSVTRNGPGLRPRKPSSASFSSLLFVIVCCLMCFSRARAESGLSNSSRCCKGWSTYASHYGRARIRTLRCRAG